VCLFSAIGYTKSTTELTASIHAMASHLDPGGLLVVDPWFHPDGWEGGHLDHTVAIENGRKVLRLAQSSRHDRTSRVIYHYLVGDSGGIDHFTDVHEMTLFTPQEYTSAIHDAGCDHVEFIEGWTRGRGRIAAIKM
jgi:hypothetical protein